MAVPQLFVQTSVQTVKTKLEHDFYVLKIYQCHFSGDPYVKM